MAWTNPRTWVTGETVTASMMNTHVRDNFNAVSPVEISYTPTWYDGAGSPPLWANGTRTGAYCLFGKAVIGVALVTAAASGSFTPTSDWSFDLPLGARETGEAGVGWYWYNDSLNGTIRPQSNGPGITRAYLLGTNGTTPAASSICQVTYAYMAN